MNSNCKYVLFACVLVKLNMVWGDMDNIGLGYPESPDDDVSKQHVQGKKPLELPSKCRVGELFYPGDQGDDYVCDCKPGHIYYPQSDRCFAAFTQGPCAPGKYLVLPENHILPVCVHNRCPVENEVFFHGACHRLNTPGPCPLPELNNVISVNSTTLQLQCISPFAISFENRWNEFSDNTRPPPPGEYYPARACFTGSKRWNIGKCIFYVLDEPQN